MKGSLRLALQLAAARGRPPGGAAGPGAWPARPPGPLVWLHDARGPDPGPLRTLAERLETGDAPPALLVTSEDAGAGAEGTAGAPPGPPGADRAGAAAGWPAALAPPPERREAVRAFLDHWRPDAGLWVGARFRPVLLHGAAGRPAPMILFDARASELAEHLPRWRRGLARALLAGFSGLHARDGAARDLLLRLGADPARIEVSGALEEGAQALECEEAERARLAGQIAARPVWCVAGCTELEEALVLRAHAQARRLTYRLLLVVATEDAGRAPWLAARCREAGLTAVLHGSGAPLRETVDVLIGPGAADMGLFYRLASVTFMGGTLNGAGGRSPFEPAALGSAILHGPLTGRHAGLYARLGAAGATREVDSAEALAQALEATLVPARAAEAALAAWDVASRGVEVADRAATLIEAALAEGHAA